MKFLFAVLLLAWLAISALAGQAGVFVENSELKVTVSAAGVIAVFDKAGKYTWKQRSQAARAGCANLTAASNSVAFDSVFGGERPLPAHVQLQLQGRSVTFRVAVDATNTPMTAFDFLEPFQPATNMSLVVPDFCDGHFYPCTLASWPLYNLDSVRVLNLTMPWVAVVDLGRGAGYSLTVDTPNDAQLKLAPVDGVRAPLIAWNPELNRFGYTRSLTYTFAAQGGYVALARAYREQLRIRGTLVTLAEKVRTRPVITNLYGAPILWDFDGQLPDQTLQARGVARALHHVERWGGGAATREKLDLANRLGFVTEEYDYYLAGPVDGRAQQYQDYHIEAAQCVRDAAGRIVGGENDWGMRCSEFYLPTARRIIPARLKAFPQTARYFDQITQNFNGHDAGPRGGGSTEECLDPGHPKSRTAWVADVDNFYRYAAQSLGLITGAELGKFHQVPFTELFYGMESCYWPWPDVVFPAQRGANTNAWNLYERWAMNPAVRLPLWELVFHDCGVATLYPWDGNDVCFKLKGTNQDLKDCLNVLYGTPAMFLVGAHQESEYFHQPRRWLQSYRNTCKILEVLADKEMTGHRFLTADRQVQESDWSDGTRIVVNFGPHDFSTGGQILKQFCFAATGPWGFATRGWDPGAGRILTRIVKASYCFDDRQLSGGQPVSLALSLNKTNSLRVNADELPGQTNVCLVIRPTTVQADWDLASTHVYACDETDGRRLREISWEKSGTDGIGVQGLKDWVVLDVECRQGGSPVQSAGVNAKLNAD